jgi:glycosyltransferase involved in cell wall biosynthesis
MKYSIGVLEYWPSKQLAGQYDGLAKQLDGYEFTILYRRPDIGNPAWPAEFCKLCRNEILPQLPKSLSRIRNLDTNITPILDRHNFDAMVIFGLYDSLSVWQAFAWCQRHHKPCFIRCDSNVSRDGRFFRRLTKGWIISRRVRQAAGMLYIGTQNRKYYECFGAKPEQLFCAPWEIDYPVLETVYQEAIQQREHIRQQLSLAPNTCVVITASRLLPVKGYDLLIPAMADLRAKGCNIELLIAGDGPYRKEMEAKVDRLGAPVRLLGNLGRKQLIEAMTASDVFALPSFWEPWGLVVNEAVLCGLPIVVSDRVGAGVDLVRDGKNGYVFPANDRAKLVTCLGKLADDPKMRASMGQESQCILREWRTDFSAVKGYREALNRWLPLDKNISVSE